MSKTEMIDIGVYVISTHRKRRLLQRKVWSAFPHVLNTVHIWYVVSKNVYGEPNLLQTGTKSCTFNALTGMRDGYRRNYTHVIFTDDDVFLHTPRMVAEMRRIPFHKPVLYGQIGWVAGWNTALNDHYGYTNTDMSSIAKLWRKKNTEQGPFPFAYGFFIGMSRPLVKQVLHSPDTSRMAQRVKKKLTKIGCHPQYDTAIGYLIARTGHVPILYDVTSSGLVHFWRGIATYKDVPDRLMVLHKATLWKEHFAWVLSILANYTSPYEYRYAYTCKPRAIHCSSAPCKRAFFRYNGHTHCSSNFQKTLRFQRVLPVRLA